MKFSLTSIVLFALVGVSLQNCSEEFKKAFLDKHNELRGKHGVGSLSLDETVNAFAQEWANHLASTGKFEHRPNNTYGENIHRSSSSDGAGPTGDATVQSWYNEIKNYHYYGREPPSNAFLATGHFTQVVWKATQRVGVGCGKAGNSTTIVADYAPAGNMGGEYAANVPAPT